MRSHGIRPLFNDIINNLKVLTLHIYQGNGGITFMFPRWAGLAETHQRTRKNGAQKH